jgi:predicted nucleic-acid-binding Zn-ribbon protein
MPVMCPLPSHLAKNLKLDERSNENVCKGIVLCDCLNDEFMIYYYGILKNKIFKVQTLHPIKDELESTSTIGIIGVCPKCGREITVFDSNIHGYNSFLKKKARIKRNLYKQFTCSKCDSALFKIYTEFNFVEIDTIDNLELMQLNDGKKIASFDWLSVNLTCVNCTKENHHFIDYETV